MPVWRRVTTQPVLKWQASESQWIPVKSSRSGDSRRCPQRRPPLKRAKHRISSAGGRTWVGTCREQIPVGVSHRNSACAFVGLQRDVEQGTQRRSTASVHWTTVCSSAHCSGQHRTAQYSTRMCRPMCTTTARRATGYTPEHSVSGVQFNTVGSASPRAVCHPQDVAHSNTTQHILIAAVMLASWADWPLHGACLLLGLALYLQGLWDWHWHFFNFPRIYKTQDFSAD
jgi:hypothetical protein|mmetsp:Transcript_22509/g.38404  ORF Transcript_22509/g.38404 Transcript_22509/m.38404 type:complete len:228 (-) Transcript_22509:782-1465(-)